MDQSVSTRLIIGGDWREPASGRFFDVHNPARPDELVGRAARGSREDTRLAIETAHRASPAWAALSYHERGAFLRRVQQAVTADAADLQARIRLLTREHGKILRESTLEMTRLGDRFEYTASLADRLAEEERIPGPPFDSVTFRQPLGVVGLIVPWNWPLSILGAKLPQALMAGNTVVIKPSSHVPLATMLTLKHMADVFPPGVINVVTGSAEDVGGELLDHPLVRKIDFTGGVEGGKQVMRRAAETLKRLTLELGGNDPAIVLEDADVSADSIRKLFLGAFMSTGQVCMAAKRVYVQRSLFSRLVEAFRAFAAQTVVGDGLEARTTMGPLNNRPQLAWVRQLIEDARHHGARVEGVGQKLDADAFEAGYFCLPTIVTDVDPGARVVMEEQFGPVLPFIPFDRDEDAIAMANAGELGLCSSIWTVDRDRALKLARRLECGLTYINNHGPAGQDNRVPFGGVKQSGMGRQLGFEGVVEMLDTHGVTAPAGWLFPR